MSAENIAVPKWCKCAYCGGKFRAQRTYPKTVGPNSVFFCPTCSDKPDRIRSIVGDAVPPTKPVDAATLTVTEPVFQPPRFDRHSHKTERRSENAEVKLSYSLPPQDATRLADAAEAMRSPFSFSFNDPRARVYRDKPDRAAGFHAFDPTRAGAGVVNPGDPPLLFRYQYSDAQIKAGAAAAAGIHSPAEPGQPAIPVPDAQPTAAQESSIQSPPNPCGQLYASPPTIAEPASETFVAVPAASICDRREEKID